MYAFTIDEMLMLDETRLAYERRGHKVQTRAFSYSTPPVLLLPVQTVAAPVLFATDKDSLYVWTGLLHSERDTDHFGGFGDASGLTVRIELMGTAFLLTGDGNRLVGRMSGSGEWPHLFSYPLILPPGERVVATFRGGNNGTDQVQLTTLGAKLYTDPYTTATYGPDV